MTQVGTWKVNLSMPTTLTIRKRGDEAPRFNQYRPARAPTFIRPNINSDEFRSLGCNRTPRSRR